ncbi:MAG: pseudouridine synthase [Candidatus Peribacteraceae bacterium]|nr:pseudouridine synthase [Candidatus Peribacteraceae bacterium]
MQERIQKILSARGVCSRRKAEEYILAGLVKVNGAVAILGTKADPETDTIEVDGKALQDRLEMLYYVMNKPVGVETTNVEGNRGIRRVRRTDRFSSDSSASSDSSDSSVRDLLPPDLRGKIFPVGRLDKDSSGLLLFTNDGVLAFRLTHPKFDHEKEYEVILDRPIDNLACRKIEEGLFLGGNRTKPIKVTKMAPDRVRLVLTEGKNRQIRRMWQQIGYTVKQLRRVRIMTLTDEALRSGTCRALTEAEKDGLLRSVGI